MPELNITIGENVQGRRYPPVGECIYCGSDGGVDGLRDEHIIAFSLGGTAVLPKASCKACEDITKNLDGYLARSVFYDLRLHTDAPTRRPKERPSTRPADIDFGAGPVPVDFKIKDHPFAASLPIFGLPGVLADEQPGRPLIIRHVAVHQSVPEGLPQTLGLKAGQRALVTAKVKINPDTFARAITKIAYCQAVATMGLHGFRRLVTTDIIRDRYAYPAYFVGSNDVEHLAPKADGPFMHQIGFVGLSQGRLRLLMAAVRLFANSGSADVGMPVYQVIVGAPGPGSDDYLSATRES